MSIGIGVLTHAGAMGVLELFASVNLPFNSNSNAKQEEGG
jgi:hypothetical protein